MVASTLAPFTLIGYDGAHAPGIPGINARVTSSLRKEISPCPSWHVVNVNMK